MVDVGAHRDEWMRRTGPLYPLLVAARLQSQLPLARDLVPSSEDEVRAEPWIALVGLGVGVGLALLAALLLEVGLAAVACAGVVAVAAFLGGGLLYERAAGASLLQLLERGLSSRQTLSDGVVISAVLASALVLRVACLAGTATGAWTGALVASQLAGRWALAGTLVLSRNADDSIETAWGAIGVVSAIALTAAMIAAGPVGLVAVILAVPAAVLAARRSKTVTAHDRGAVAALLAELAALLVIAMAAPPVSGWPL